MATQTLKDTCTLLVALLHNKNKNHYNSNNTDTSMAKWINSLSDILLMEAKESHLARGPNYAIALLYLP